MTLSTPSGIAEASYQAGRGRRYADKAGLPDPRRAWKPDADPVILSAILRRAFDAHLEQLLPLADRAEIALQLDADLDRRFPADDMVVLDRYGFARQIDSAGVLVGGAQPMWFALPRSRRVPNARDRSDHLFTAIGPASLVVPLVPEHLLGAFEAVVAAHGYRHDQFVMAAAWPADFHFKRKRRPTWAEIEATFPRIGAWMAKQRAS